MYNGFAAEASQQVWDLYIIPDMFAQYATGRMTLDQAIGWGELAWRRHRTATAGPFARGTGHQGRRRPRGIQGLARSS